MALSAEELNVAKAGLRLLRDAKLAETDWHMVTDSPTTGSDLTDMTNYRKYLRDLPAGMSDDDFATWTGLLTLEEWKAS